MGKFKDLTGMRFGKLTVIERADDHVTVSGNKFVKWKCICDCQDSVSEDKKQYYTTFSSSLLNGKRVSCGCDSIERKSKAMKKYHERRRSTYDLSNEFGVGTTYNGDVFYFDLNDYEKIKDFNWFVNDQGYLLAYINNRHTVRMHRVIMNAQDGEEVDHKRGKTSRHDNRRDNLRIASHSQNNINKGLLSTNTSGATGVDYVTRIGKWRARIHLDGTEISLGYYECKKDAIIAREQAEEEYFGEWSYKNSTGGNINGENKPNCKID